MAVTPVVLKLGDTHTRFAPDQKQTFDARKVFGHRRAGDNNIFARDQADQTWHVDKVRFVLECTLHILWTLTHTLGGAQIVKPHLGYPLIRRSGKSQNCLWQAMALHVTSQASDTEGQFCMHATPVTME